jgi:hypothetical protein
MFRAEGQGRGLTLRQICDDGEDLTRALVQRGSSAIASAADRPWRLIVGLSAPSCWDGVAILVVIPITNLGKPATWSCQAWLVFLMLLRV